MGQSGDAELILQFYDIMTFLLQIGRRRLYPPSNEWIRWETVEMATTLLLAGLMLAQSAPAITVEAQPGLDQVGYQALSAGRPDLAIERISADPVLSASDPAALINLGTAYARTGDRPAAL